MEKVKRGISLQERLTVLTIDVVRTLTKMVENSPIKSRFIDSNAIDVSDIYIYTELAICDSELIFIDEEGYHYTAEYNASLETLIDIIIKQEENN